MVEALRLPELLHPQELQSSYVWRNYIVFACATVSDQVCRSVGPGRPRPDSWPASVADLFNFILPFLKSDLHCNSAVLVIALQNYGLDVKLMVCGVWLQALERCNGAVYDTLFETLRPYEQDYTRRRRKGVDQLRNHVSCTYFALVHILASALRYQ